MGFDQPKSFNQGQNHPYKFSDALEVEHGGSTLKLRHRTSIEDRLRPTNSNETDDVMGEDFQNRNHDGSPEVFSSGITMSVEIDECVTFDATDCLTYEQLLTLF
jgi:hypothetical protein